MLSKKERAEEALNALGGEADQTGQAVPVIPVDTYPDALAWDIYDSVPSAPIADSGNQALVPATQPDYLANDVLVPAVPEYSATQPDSPERAHEDWDQEQAEEETLEVDPLVDAPKIPRSWSEASPEQLDSCRGDPFSSDYQIAMDLHESFLAEDGQTGSRSSSSEAASASSGSKAASGSSSSKSTDKKQESVGADTFIGTHMLYSRP